MNFTRCLFAMLALAALQVAHAQAPTANEQVQRLFASLQSKDETAYTRLYPNGQQMGRIIRSMMAAMMQSDEMKAAMAADPNAKNLNIDSLVDVQVKQSTTPEAEKKMQEKFASFHKNIIGQGQKRAIKWEEAKLTGFTLDSTSALQGPEGQMMAKSGLKTVDGVIDFNAGGTDYRVNFEKMIYIPEEKGWFGGEFKQVIRKGENFSSADEVNVVSEEAPKADVKSKSKTKTGDVKTKTKTSGGKTTTKTKAKTKA